MIAVLSPAAEAGIDAAREHAQEAWYAAALEAVARVAAARPTFTTDDVWSALDPVHQTHEHRAMGPVMRDARSRGLCLPANAYRPSLRPERHGGPVRLWLSTNYHGSTI